MSNRRKPANPKECGLAGCTKPNEPGSDVGYRINDKLYEVRICMHHTQMITSSPRGTFTITSKPSLEVIKTPPIIL